MKVIVTLTVLVLCISLKSQVPEYDMFTTTVNDTIGILYDDGGKDFNYFPDQNNTFTIKASNGKPITIRFDQFSVETNELGLSQLCIYDFLTIYDGEDVNADQVGMYCGSEAPPQFTSTGDALTLNFTSDGATQFAGFTMAWSTGDLPQTDVDRYCPASGPACGEEFYHISEFSFGDFTNTSQTCDAPFGVFNNYSDFTDSIITYTSGETVNVSGLFNTSLATELAVDLYIDWNQDGDFEDNGERTPLVASPATLEFLGVVLPPMDFVPGLTRLRIRAYDPVFGLGLIGPCGEAGDGEVEDYTLLVVDPDAPLPDCPSPVAPADGATNQCSTLQFRWNNVASADTFNLKIFSENDSRNFEALTDTFLNVEELLPNTNYQWLVVAENENGSSILCDTLEFSTGNANPTAAFDAESVSVCPNESFTFSAVVSEGDAPYDFAWSGDGAAFLDDVNAEMPNLANPSPGVYTLSVSVTDTRGCQSNTASQELVIKSVLQAEDIELLNPVACSNEDIKFVYNANFNAVFQESDDNVTFTDFPPNYLSGDTVLYNQPNAGEKFIRAIVTSNGCSDTSAVVTQERLAPLAEAEIDFFAGEAVNCPEDEVAMQAANYDSDITWSNGATTDTITITESGSYSYTYTDANGCSTTSEAIDVTVVELDAPLALNVTADTVALCEGEALILAVNNENAVWNDANNTANDTLVVSTEGLYKATVTKDGCAFVSDSVFVQVNPTPAPIALDFDSEQSLCAGTDSLVITGVEGMEWTVPAGVTTETITVFESGSYFGSITNEFGCTALSDTADVVFNEAPAQPEITREDSILFVEGAEGNARIWILDGTNISINDTIVLDEPGEYQVVLVSEEGCISDTSDVFLFDPNSIDEGVLRLVDVFPNPTDNVLNIVNLPSEGATRFTVIDVNGAVILQKSTNNRTMQLNLNVAEGVYFLQITTDSARATRKIVVRK